MKNISFLYETFQFLEVKFSIYSKTSIIRSARDCRNSFKLSLVLISEICSFRICSDFLFNIVEVMGTSALKIMSCLKVELIIFYA